MFKKCSLCTCEWSTRDEFLNDPENHFEGYVYLKTRALDGVPVEGLLLFTHCHPQCGTTLAIAASRFRSQGENADDPRLRPGLPQRARRRLQ